MSAARDKAEAMRAALSQGVRAVSAPSLFETPYPVIEKMMLVAGLKYGETVLEPSSGTGRLARAAFERTGLTTACVEINPDLAKLGYMTRCADFMTLTPLELGGFDCVVMNPPFENGQDREHVRHAFRFLKPGGRLVAIMGEGVFCRDRRADREFREWLDSVGGTSEKLPEGAFKTSGTGVSTRMVCVRKQRGD